MESLWRQRCPIAAPGTGSGRYGIISTGSRLLLHAYGDDLLSFRANLDRHWRPDAGALNDFAAHQRVIRSARSVFQQIVDRLVAWIDDHRMFGLKPILVPQSF